MAQDIHASDIGTEFLLTVKDQDGVVVDVSSATTQEIVFEKPDETTITRTTSFKRDGTDGEIVYQTVSGDLDQSGQWRFQVRLILSDGEWRSDVVPFTVEDNL